MQKVTRLKLQEENREEEVLIRALELINSDNIEKEDMTNIVSIWEYASKHGKLIDDFYFNSTYAYWGPLFAKKSIPLHLLAEYGSYKAIIAILTHIENITQVGLEMLLMLQVVMVKLHCIWLLGMGS